MQAFQRPIDANASKANRCKCLRGQKMDNKNLETPMNKRLGEAFEYQPAASLKVHPTSSDCVRSGLKIHCRDPWPKVRTIVYQVEGPGLR